MAALCSAILSKANYYWLQILTVKFFDKAVELQQWLITFDQLFVFLKTPRPCDYISSKLLLSITNTFQEIRVERLGHLLRCKLFSCQ